MRKSTFYGSFVLNHRVVLDTIDAALARWRGNAASSPPDGASTGASSPRHDLVKNCRVHPTHWLISTQVDVLCAAVVKRKIDGATLRDADDASLRELGVATLGVRKAVLKLLRAEPSAPRREYASAPSADEPPPPPPPSWRSGDES